MRLILLGPPGSGKGTQGAFLQDALGIPSISTGHILREAMANQSPLGKEAASFIKKGLLVPDVVVIRVIEKRIDESDCSQGYILDGFPRTVNQAEALDVLLAKKNKSLNAVVNLALQDEEILKRLTGRRLCRQCGVGFHLLFSPPARKGLCDRCGGELTQRDDDKEATIRNRLEVYRRQTEPLIEFYAKKGLLKNITATGNPGEIFNQVMHSLKVSK